MPTRVAFIGTGGISDRHMSAIEQIPGVDVVGVCDIIGERAAKAAQRFDCPSFTSHHEMFNQAQMDAVYICVPPDCHTDQELIAVSKGIHVFVEKPVAIGFDKGREIYRAIAENNIISAVGYHWRYNDTVEKAREILKDETIGMVLGWFCGGMPGTPWWRVKARSGGQIVEQATHIFDLARYLVGNVSRVHAEYALRVMQKDVPDFHADDVYTVNMRFSNGAIGNISASCIAGQRVNVGLQVQCRNLLLDIPGDRALTVSRAGGDVQVYEHTNDAGLAENIDFIEAVRTGNPSKIRAPYWEALLTNELCLAANQSAETGTIVCLA